jgi:hypothetical protein
MRAREFIIEAAYDGMITSMKQKFPDQVAVIDQWVKWAKTSLKKADRVTWFLKILRADLAQTLGAKELGTYRFSTIQKLANDIHHFYGIEYPPIHDYVYKDQPVSQIISDLRQLEIKWQNNQQTSKGVEIQHGDYELFEFPDGTAWWWVNRAYCPEEGRSGGHCGNVVGQEKTDQRILSLRNKNNQVICTFILEPDGTLGEMKAVNNQKPSEKYHPQILKLLMWDRIKGISNTEYQYNPSANFNVFDLNEQQLAYLDTNKPELITSQIYSSPTSALRMPDSLKDRYKNLLDQIDPNLGALLLDNSPKNWETAVRKNPALIIHAPKTISDWRGRVVATISGYDEIPDDETGELEIREIDDGLEWEQREHLLLQAPPIISKDTSIVRDIIFLNPDIFSQVSPNIRGYESVAEIAVSKNGRELEYVPKERQTSRICKLAVKNYGRALQYASDELKTIELCKLAVEKDGSALTFVPAPILTDDIIKVALKNNGRALMYVPPRRRTREVCEVAVAQSPAEGMKWVPLEFRDQEFYEKMVKANPVGILVVPAEEVTDDMAISAIKAKPELVKLLDNRLQTLERWIIAVIESPRMLAHAPEYMANDIAQEVLKRRQSSTS